MSGKSGVLVLELSFVSCMVTTLGLEEVIRSSSSLILFLMPFILILSNQRLNCQSVWVSHNRSLSQLSQLIGFWLWLG